MHRRDMTCGKIKGVRAKYRESFPGSNQLTTNVPDSVFEWFPWLSITDILKV